MYCGGPGLSAPSGNCTEGYYCPPGQIYPAPPEKKCQAGHYCPTASIDHHVCEPSYYQPDPGKGSCIECPEGFYCDPIEANGLNASGINSTSHGVVNPSPCPAGYFCPKGTYMYSKYPCQKGYFGNETKRASHDGCYPCTPGYYCDRAAMTRPEYYCHVGYYCSEKATSPEPKNSTEGGGPCLPGFYCESGYSQPLPCPKGTYGSRSNLGSVNECTDCDGGMYCAQYGLPAPNGSCLAGYFCKSKAILPNPVNEVYGDVCPRGYYCPESTTTAFACPPGTFNNQTKATRAQDCLPCRGGWYCAGYANADPDGMCDPGYYCTTGAYKARPVQYTGLSHNSTDIYSCPIYSVNQTGGQCPNGTYCPKGSSEPVPCDQGKHCDIAGLESPLGNCTKGYYCDFKSTSSKPIKCKSGHYCPEGTTLEKECPFKTFNPYEGQSSLIDCKNCTAGYYCPHSGMTEATFQCLQGYYCPAGSWMNDTIECPRGFYCPTGSGAPKPCTPGMSICNN